jgi:hypothetical protein
MQHCAGFHAFAHDGIDAMELPLVDDRAERDLLARRVAHRQLQRLRLEPLSEFSRDLLVRQDAARGHADLALVEPGAKGCARSGRVQVGVVQDDQASSCRRVPASPSSASCAAQCSPTLAAGGGRAGEGDHGDVRVGADRLADVGAARAAPAGSPWGRPASSKTRAMRYAAGDRRCAGPA